MKNNGSLFIRNWRLELLSEHPEGRSEQQKLIKGIFGGKPREVMKSKERNGRVLEIFESVFGSFVRVRLRLEVKFLRRIYVCILCLKIKRKLLMEFKLGFPINFCN